jgi:hypothetical protein
MGRYIGLADELLMNPRYWEILLFMFALLPCAQNIVDDISLKNE